MSAVLRGGVEAAVEGLDRLLLGTVGRPLVAVLDDRESEARIQALIRIARIEVDGAGIALAEGLAALLELVLVHEGLRRAVAGRAVLDAHRVVGHLEGVELAAAQAEDELRIVERVVAPQGTVGAELQAPGGGIVQDDLAGLGGRRPPAPVVRRVEERGRRIEQRAGLQGEGGAAGRTADFAVHFRDIGNRQVRGDLVDLLHDELHDLVGRGPGDGVGLGVGEGGGHERNVAVGAEQLEVEVGSQEADLIREEFQLLDPVAVIRVVLPGGDVRLGEFLQEHVGVGDGGVALGPGPGVRIGRAPAAVHVVVHGAGLQGVLGLVGRAGEEVGAVGLELVVVHLRINVEYHVLDTILEILVGPFLVAGVLLTVVEVHARGREQAGENE